MLKKDYRQNGNQTTRNVFVAALFIICRVSPKINYSPFGHPDFPTAICPCNNNIFKTNNCSGATYNWTISSKIPGGGAEMLLF